MQEYDVIIIGAGAAGLIAAGVAAEKEAKVLLLEKMDRPARKLFITGKGRCNLTNVAPQDDFISHFGHNGNFLRQAFNRFPPESLIAFFESLGVKTVVERGGRVFPRSQKSGDVVNALIQNIKDKGVTLRNNTVVEELIVVENQLAGVLLAGKTASEKLYSGAVIIAAGGKSYPATGSTGDGYRLAKSTGHNIIPVHPALVPLETAESIPHNMIGLSLRNISATLTIDNKKAAEEFGELEFTEFGLTGPIVLTLSRRVVAALQAKSTVEISIDLKPALDSKKLDLRLQRDLESMGRKAFISILKSLLPVKLIPVCIEHVGINPDKPVHQITGKERRTLGKWLKDFRVSFSGHRPFTEAIITAGGVDTAEIDPRSMASRLIDGLFFAGEVIDIDADTGGYNLQAAFSTGWMAGKAAVKYVKEA
ncbi:MAG: NAD(P)/FAD-dependent oxidoreductase [Calditrichaeota bacterium]|nr:NAD(P)/FAD-dependent oxidoreductase [Calditrichota bacterium]